MKFSAVTLRSCKNSEAHLKAAEKCFDIVIYHKPKRLVRRWTDPPQEVNKPLIITSAPPWVDDKQQTVCCTVTYCIFHCVESMFASGTWFLVSTNKLLVFACLSSHEHEMKRKLNVSLCNRGGLMSSFLLPESIRSGFVEVCQNHPALLSHERHKNPKHSEFVFNVVPGSVCLLMQERHL